MEPAKGGIFHKGPIAKTKRPAARKRPGDLAKVGNKTGSVELRLSNAADRSETLLEFVDATFGIDELRESGEEGVRIGSNTDRDEAMFHAIDDFLLFGSFGRTADKTLAGGHVNEDDRIVFWMKVLFHGSNRVRHVSDAAGRGEWLNSSPCQAGIQRHFSNITQILKINACKIFFVV
jgi:hypothetical protein